MSPETKTAYRHAIGETKLVCRDVSMTAVQSLGTRLVERYVLYGVHIAVQLERRAREAEKIKAEAMTTSEGRSDRPLDRGYVSRRSPETILAARHVIRGAGASMISGRFRASREIRSP
jgi:hypothetical protein